MPQFLILIYQRDSAVASPTAAWQQSMAAHRQFAERVAIVGGTIFSANALQPTPTATSIRDDVVTDGPYVATEDVLVGYYLIGAADLDQALAIAKLCPAPSGGVEVRPVVDPAEG